jgi:hypothetical protein
MKITHLFKLLLGLSLKIKQDLYEPDQIMTIGSNI